MIELGDGCFGITKTSNGFQLRLGPTGFTYGGETSYIWHRYSTEDFEINITYEK